MRKLVLIRGCCFGGLSRGWLEHELASCFVLSSHIKGNTLTLLVFSSFLFDLSHFYSLDNWLDLFRPD